MSKNSVLEQVAVVHIESRFIHIETISVQASGAVLAGAWSIGISEIEKISGILDGKNVIPITPESRKFVNNIQELKFPSLDDFLIEAKASAENTLEAFNKHIESDPKKKTLVTPSISSWPESVDLANSVGVLRFIGGQQVPANSPEEFVPTLAASMVLRYYINAWLKDESERVSRTYLKLAPDFVRLVPDSWGK